MKLVNTGILIIAVILNMGFSKLSSKAEATPVIPTSEYFVSLLDTSVKTEVTEDKFIQITSGKIIDDFLKNGFVIADNNDATKPYIILNKSDSSDIGVKIYSKSQMDKVNGIFILITLNQYTGNNGADKTKRPLNEEVFQNLKSSLSSLNCNDNIDFLRSGFTCPSDYEVLYTINGDNFDGIRKFFGFNKRSELLISIIPVSN